MGRPGIDLTGQRFGRLTVIKPIDKVGVRHKWLCKCDCGNKTIVIGNNIKNGDTVSCGCYAREKSAERLATHRKTKSRLFHVWQSMKQRCENPHAHAYADYGGRGIKVCDKWSNDFVTFEEWALAHGYDENALHGECTLDRIDVNGNYEPSNCRWVDMAQQQNNKRSAVLITYNGRTMSVADWSRETGLSHSAILGRIRRGWNVEKALTTPPLRHKKIS